MTASQLDLFVAKPTAPESGDRCGCCSHPYEEHATGKKRWHLHAPTRCMRPTCFCDGFDARKWSTGTDLAALQDGQQYVHLIRSDDDPERMAREAYGKLGLRRERAPHLKTDKTSPAAWSTAIRHYMHERDASAETIKAEKAKDARREFTFNRMAVEFFDVTADVATQTTFEAGLFSLVRRGIVEHSLEAPIVFRLVNRYETVESAWFEYLDGECVWRCQQCHRMVPLNIFMKPGHHGVANCDPEPCPACYQDEREAEDLPPLPDGFYRDDEVRA
jgi:rubrerythrin